jgi:hypothetical protein
MPSLQSRLLLFVLKHRHLLRFRLREETIDWTTNASILRFRQENEKGSSRFGKMPAGIQVSPVIIEGISAEWIWPSSATKDKVIFYTHQRSSVPSSTKEMIYANTVFRTSRRYAGLQ